MARLTISDAHGNNWVVNLHESSTCKIGSSPDCDVVLPGANISAVIKFLNGAFVLFDLSGLDPILVNGAPRLEWRFSDHDYFRTGIYVLVFDSSDKDADVYAGPAERPSSQTSASRAALDAPKSSGPASIPQRDRQSASKESDNVVTLKDVRRSMEDGNSNAGPRHSGALARPEFDRPYPSPPPPASAAPSAAAPQYSPSAGRPVQSASVSGRTEPDSSYRDPVRTGGNEPTSWWRRLFPAKPEVGVRVVECSVFAPHDFVPGEDFMVQVFAHLADQEEVARALAREFDRDAVRRGIKTLETELQIGTKLSIHLTIKGMKINGAVQELTWRGTPESVQFEVAVPDKFLFENVIGTVSIFRDSVPIGHIKFKMSARLSANRAPAALKLAGNSARAYRKAFISYASKDRTEVLKRVQMLARLKIDFFQDLLSLEPGARWESELYRHIDDCDLFLLFWSGSARDSEWVMKEVRYALARKGGGDDTPPEILPVILEGPPVVSPPPELAHLHFNDYLNYFMVN